MAALVEHDYTVVGAKDRECQWCIFNSTKENECSNQKHRPVDKYFYSPDLHYLYQFV